MIKATSYRVFFSLVPPLKVRSTKKLSWARLSVSRPIYVNVDSPYLGCPYFNFYWGYQWKKHPVQIQRPPVLVNCHSSQSSSNHHFMINPVPRLQSPKRSNWAQLCTLLKIQISGVEWLKEIWKECATGARERRRCAQGKLEKPYWRPPALTNQPFLL